MLGVQQDNKRYGRLGALPSGEGRSVPVDGTGSYDPDGHALASFDYDMDGDGIFETVGATAFFSAAGLDGPSEQYIYLKVCDEFSACAIGMAEVEIENVAPTIDALNAPVDPVTIGDRPVSVEVVFSDPGVPDTHDVTWDWGDTSSDMQSGATSPASEEHVYAEAGVYAVTVTVIDDDGGSDTEVYQYIVIYDPDDGFVTGGGWFDSPAGAYVPDSSLTDKATFGFVSKYKKGADVPTGNTEFQFHAADLNFHSDSYQWLVIAGPTAKFKGSGTINGAEGYDFMLTATDEKLTPSTDVDLFRIKIWEEATDTIVYDNKLGEADDSVAGTAIGSGSIVIHKK